MQSKQSQTIFSATDLVNFLEYEHLTALDRIYLEAPLPRSEDSEEARLFQGNPNLLTVSCRTPEHIALVNTLCWVKS